MTKQEIARRLKKLARQLDLDDWNFELLIEDSKHPQVDAANCEAKPEYLDAKIMINVAKVRNDEMHEYLVHELLHCHIWPLVNLAEKMATTAMEREAIRFEEERLTTQMERLLAPRVIS